MAEAVFNRRFDATDTTKGISIRIEPSPSPQAFPEWVIALAEDAGAAARVKSTSPAAAGNSKKED